MANQGLVIRKFLRIIKLAHEKGKITARDVMDLFPQYHPLTVVRYLKLLHEMNILSKVGNRGPKVYYELNPIDLWKV